MAMFKGWTFGDWWCQIVHRLLHYWGDDAFGIGDHERCWQCGRMWTKPGWYQNRKAQD